VSMSEAQSFKKKGSAPATCPVDCRLLPNSLETPPGQIAGSNITRAA
jgi:hypothetical protein